CLGRTFGVEPGGRVGGLGKGFGFRRQVRSGHTARRCAVRTFDLAARTIATRRRGVGSTAGAADEVFRAVCRRRNADRDRRGDTDASAAESVHGGRIRDEASAGAIQAVRRGLRWSNRGATVELARSWVWLLTLWQSNEPRRERREGPSEQIECAWGSSDR